MTLTPVKTPRFKDVTNMERIVNSFHRACIALYEDEELRILNASD